MQYQESGASSEVAAQPVHEAHEEQVQQEQVVPLSALQAERHQRQQVQDQLRMMQDHLELLKSNAQKPALIDESLSDDDVLTVGQAKKFVTQLNKEHKGEVEELKMTQQYPDYTDTVKKYLPELIKENPELREVIMAAPNPYRAAYTLAKKSDAYLKDRGVAKSPEAQKVQAQQQRAGSLSSVGTPSANSSAGGWNRMSDQEFMAAVHKNLGYV